MSYIYNKNSRPQLVSKYAGGKGYNLFLLSNQNINVPDFQLISSQAFLDFIEAHNLEAQIEAFATEAKENMSIKEADTIHKNIEELFLKYDLPEQIDIEITKAFERLGDSISVRSSAAGEDSAAHSFAGQLSSFLYLSKDTDIKIAVKKCWASGFTGRSLAYRLSKKLSILDTQVAIVMQNMINPDISGVIFTQNLIESNPEEIIISSVYGVGEGIVSGALDADTFYFHRKTKEVRQEIAAKEHKFIADPDAPGSCIEVELSADMIEQSTLSSEQINKLAQISLDVEKYYLFPQDIEFAILKDVVYILQSRPITTTQGEAYLQEGQIIVWDNSNIIESYPGVTTPLTFSFASHVYKTAYYEMMKIVGVNNKILEEHTDTFRNMLGIINGRIYYNLVNWYKLLSSAPGFDKNKSSMETMLGVSEKMPQEVIEALIPNVKKPTLKSRLSKFKGLLSGLFVHFTINKRVEGFFDKFWKTYNIYSEIDYKAMTTDKIVQHYLKYRDRILKNWQEPLMNDFLLMVHFGILKKLTGKWCSELDSNLQNDLLSGEGGLESAEPTLRIVELCSHVVKNPQLQKIFETQSPEHIFEVIGQDQSFSNFNDLVHQYIKRFGFRCMGELKLEEKDLNSNPSYLFSMIKNYLRTGNTDPDEFVKNEKKLRNEAEAKVNGHLKGIKKKVYYWSLKNTRNAVKNRENTRFARTRFFGIVRNMFQAIGLDLFRKSILNHPDDVFYLTVEEIIGYSEGRSVTQNLAQLAENRKQEYAKYASEEDPAERFYTKGTVYVGNNWSEGDAVIEDDLPENMLKGLPCSPGVVKNKVKIILSPNDDLNLNGEILVTARTDPGWVPIYPSISGLAIERGSLLSHSAIVARELSIPTVIKVKKILEKINSGDTISLDGSKGTIEVLESVESQK
ncbi:phosphoenolpyruvate synthase [Candidatus Uabimicrobium sp. HlEnr_7]|uniref:phosphoenolpyruvate synthase n=1 Tax=Candidatus Uabimicrobium helgolandensis TaxID=3095367 RepID=UPI003556E29D